MAIDDIQSKCEARYEMMKKEFKGKTHANKHPVQSTEKEKPADFNDPKRRVEYAKAQMASIEKYLVDYIEIMHGVLKDDTTSNWLQEQRNTNQLI